jgi:hypothetical protein
LRLAGGDEHAPYWSIDAVECRASARSWDADRWLLVLDRLEGLMAIDPWTGRIVPTAFSQSGPPATMPMRALLHGDGWFAAVRDDRTDFFSPEGAHLGRDAPFADRAYVAAEATANRLFVLDSDVRAGDTVPSRFSVRLRDLDASHGGLEPSPPLLLRSLGQRLGSLAAVDGAVAASNGSVVEVVEFSDAAAPAGR